MKNHESYLNLFFSYISFTRIKFCLLRSIHYIEINLYYLHFVFRIAQIQQFITYLKKQSEPETR